MKNKRKAVDKPVYYYKKQLGDLLNKYGPKTPELTQITGDEDKKEIYNKVKGDLSDKFGDEKNDAFLFKVPAW